MIRVVENENDLRYLWFEDVDLTETSRKLLLYIFECLRCGNFTWIRDYEEVETAVSKTE